MMWVAVLLLPMLSVLLMVMDRVEDRLLAPAAPERARRRHAGRRRHLRLVRGTSGSPGPDADEPDAGTSGADEPGTGKPGVGKAGAGESGVEPRVA
ncbi:hypothetical protein AB0E25_27490 [Streptomyces bobili]|uniref:hypothetical protein n=1 Tax=Streptomyces bobili TaxID=67280 RepID=UPI00340C9ACB